jgi:hypothetical protein
MTGMSELVEGGIYEVRSRNLDLAVYDGNGGFTGIREKLGSRYLFTEYLRDGGPAGTVTPGRQVASLLPGVPAWERDPDCPVQCLECGKKAWWTGPPAPAPWACEGRCAPVRPAGAGFNGPLYDILAAIGNLSPLGNGLEGYSPAGLHQSLLTKKKEKGNPS